MALLGYCEKSTVDCRGLEAEGGSLGAREGRREKKTGSEGGLEGEGQKGTGSEGIGRWETARTRESGDGSLGFGFSLFSVDGWQLGNGNGRGREGS